MPHAVVADGMRGHFGGPNGSRSVDSSSNGIEFDQDLIMAAFGVLQLFAEALPQSGNACLHGFEGRFGISEDRLVTCFGVLYLHLEASL